MKSIFILILLNVVCISAVAQEVNVVFDVTSPDTAVQAAAVRHIEMMSKAYPKSSFELIIYSGAFPMAIKTSSTVTEKLVQLAKRPNVSLKVCSMTLQKHHLDENQLLQGVGTVPDGIMELVLKQQAGWAYIKEAN